jgi:3-hydroxyacyl-[acyl-carrier-protein] dehydratase
VFFASITEAKFRKPVVPGDQLRIEVNFLKLKATVAKVQGRATVDGNVVAEAEILATLGDKQTA